MAIDLKQTAIDPDLPEVPPTRNTKAALRAALDDIQGNILKSHGRNRSRHLFITFKTGSPGAGRRPGSGWPRWSTPSASPRP
ncbi:hypothetical protein ACFW1M_23185 [Streptomyces inhibens]|uniref:hypothetical protein n=1 Tax=Streptomyces inhibens TaxID=2293571 RepID=UPI003675A1D5